MSDCGARPSNSETKASVVDKPFEVDAGVAVEIGLFGRLVVPADPARAAEVQDLARQAAVWATRARGEGTLRAYRSAWTAYSAWCDRLGFAPLTGEADVIGMYLVKAAERLTVPTLRVHLATIATIATGHRFAGVPVNLKHPRIALERRGHAREHGSARRQATPLTDAVLGPVLERLTPADERPLRPIDRRDRALLLVGRDTLARVDELVALHWADLRPVDPDDPAARPGEGTIRIRRSKTDPEGEGAEVWLSAEAMAALAAWRAVAPCWPDPVTGAPTREGLLVFGHLRRSAPGEGDAVCRPCSAIPAASPNGHLSVVLPRSFEEHGAAAPRRPHAPRHAALPRHRDNAGPPDPSGGLAGGEVPAAALPSDRGDQLRRSGHRPVLRRGALPCDRVPVRRRPRL
ncbi:hypothetical protein [Azospirillum brasilense]|uniref:hypothetical protein n=1 Tax=Azospirillum brasilense TaxID=192 RepID=UPI001B3B74BE|nr:hypothetical protein [Azospirillum brasilense]